MGFIGASDTTLSMYYCAIYEYLRLYFRIISGKRWIGFIISYYHRSPLWCSSDGDMKGSFFFCVSLVWQGIPVSKKQNVPLYISFITRMHACEQTSYITIIPIISVDRHILPMLKNYWFVILAPNGCGKIYKWFCKSTI